MPVIWSPSYRPGNLAIRGPHPWADAGAHGALFDGVTDDYAAIMRAYTALPSRGGTILLPAGTGIIGTMLEFNKPVILQGQGRGAKSTNANAGPGATYLTWGGAAGGTMIRYRPGEAVYTLHGGAVYDCYLNGANLANKLIHASDVGYMTFDRLTMIGPRTHALHLDYDLHLGSLHNQIGQVLCIVGDHVDTRAAHGIVIGNLVTQTTIVNLYGVSWDGDLLRFEDTDNNKVISAHCLAVGTGYGVAFRNSAPNHARHNMLWYVVGQVKAESSTWGNRIMALVSEAGGVDVDSGGQIHYEVIDSITSEVYATHQYRMSDEHPIPAGAFMNIAGTAAALGFTGAGNWACWNLPDSAAGTITAWVRPYGWDAGTITKARVMFSTGSANTSDQAGLICGISTHAPALAANATAISAVEATTSNTYFDVNDVADRHHYVDITLNHAYARGDEVLLQITRNPGDASDTVTGHIQILGVTLYYTGTGPNGGSELDTYDVGLPYRIP